MASSLYNLALDFSKELNYTKAIMARQGDKGITVTVKPFLNGLQMDTSGGTFTLKGTTPSNRYVDSVATSVTSEEVTFSLDGTFMSEAGYYKHCYVEYRKDDKILTTQDIIFFSLGVSDISQGQADEYVSQLEELIRKYNETFDAFMAEIKGRVDSLNQQITDLTGQAKTLQDKLDALKEEISKLGNLQVMYSNSINFGNYDYSGNPNLMINIKLEDLSSEFTGYRKPTNVTMENGCFVIDVTKLTGSQGYYILDVPRGLEGKRYTYSVEAKADVATQGIAIRPVYHNGTALAALTPSSVGSLTTTMTRYKLTTNPLTAQQVNSTIQAFQIYIVPSRCTAKKIYVKTNIKMEEGIEASGFQPNLLDAPYYFSKVALGENLIKPESQQPVTNSNYLINTYNIKPMVKGKKYTITLEGTKPATQVFRPFFTRATGDAWEVGDLQPVEGLTDVWSGTFTAAADPHPTSPQVQICQVPSTSLGNCTIKWLKLEEGDTRTPNIEQYKYLGIGMRDSNNPKDYVWDLAPEYVEDNLATDVKISEITGKANNYTDGKVSEINSQLTASINEVDTTAKDAQTKANANATAIKSTNSRVDEIKNIITALTKEETYLLPASIVNGGSLKFTSRGGMTVATGSFKLAKDIAFGEVLVNDLPDSMINIDNNAIGTGAVTGNSVSQIYVESNTRKVVANTAMKKDQWFTVGFSYHSKLSI